MNEQELHVREDKLIVRNIQVIAEHFLECITKYGPGVALIKPTTKGNPLSYVKKDDLFDDNVVEAVQRYEEDPNLTPVLFAYPDDSATLYLLSVSLGVKGWVGKVLSRQRLPTRRFQGPGIEPPPLPDQGYDPWSEL